MRRLTILVLFLYAGLTVYTVLRMVLQEPSLPLLTPFLTLLAFTFAALHAAQRTGWKRMVLLLALCFGVSLLFESIGVATGLVYGPYHYTDRLGAKFLGLVPYLIPVAWFMMMYPSLVIAETITAVNQTPGKIHLSSIIKVAALGGIIMTAWDLALDPLMVGAGHWIWDGPINTRPYFGVPLQNYWGWWLTTFVTFCLYFLISRIQKTWWDPSHPASGSKPLQDISTQPRSSMTQDTLTNWGLASPKAFDRLAVLSYVTTALGNTLTALLVGFGGPALVGLFAMGPWIFMVWPRLRENAQPDT